MKQLMKYNLLLIILFVGLQVTGQEKSNTKSDPNVPIFEIKNDQGQTVFAVYPGGVKIFIDEQLKAAGGGFTVGRLNTGKATAGDILTVNPNNVNIYIDDAYGTKAAGGGFTVGRLNTGKKAAGDEINFMKVTPDSTRIYTNETSDRGFAVGKLSTELGSQNFLDLTPLNYFIGHESGRLTSGTYNLFLGYRAGYNNTSGNSNYFAGYQAGFNNTTGYYNIFIGRESGFYNTVGQRNIFIGDRAGYSNVGNLTGDPPTIGHDNIYIGTFAGRDNADGQHNTLIGSYSGFTSNGTKNTFVGAFTGFDASGTANVFLGVDAGRNNTAGDNNTFLGTIAGNNSSGSNNTFVGYASGYNNTSGTGNVFLGYYAGLNETGSNLLYIDNSSTSAPLIYGNFNTNILRFNAGVGINASPSSSYALQINLDGDDTYALVAYGATWCSSGAWAGSDIRFKRNIIPLNNSIEKIMKLRGVSYEWKTKEFPKNGFEKGRTIGVIAQEVELVIPELVSEGPDGYKAVAYDKLTAVLLEAIKEQQAEIDNLKQKNSKLEERLSEFDKLKLEIEDLKKVSNALVKEISEKNTTFDK